MTISYIYIYIFFHNVMCIYIYIYIYIYIRERVLCRHKSCYVSCYSKWHNVPNTHHLVRRTFTERATRWNVRAQRIKKNQKESNESKVVKKNHSGERERESCGLLSCLAALRGMELSGHSSHTNVCVCMYIYIYIYMYIHT